MTIIEDLQTAGLSEYEAKVYYELLVSGERTGRDVARASKVPPTRVFDVLSRLQEKGLVQLVQQRPMLWLPVKPDVGLKTFIDRKIASYADLQDRLVDELKKVKQEPEQKIRENVTVVGGFKEIFSLVTERVRTSSKTIEIFSIGEPIPVSAEVEYARAVKRGVKLRFIASLYNKQNKQLLEKWRTDGWVIRHLPGSQEYSFTILDNSACMIVVKNPVMKNERMLILFENKDLSLALGEYYNTLWKKAKALPSAGS